MPYPFHSVDSHYLQTLVKFALASRTKIQIATCYIFHHDPVQRYVFLDLLPYCAKKYGIHVEILLDMTVVESYLFQKSGFYDAVTADQTSSSETTRDNKVDKITNWSFEKYLPEDAPKPVKAKQILGSTSAFLEAINYVASEHEFFQVRWWCARDATAHYRIKNHCKGVVFDDQASIFGGSNLAPTVAAAESELDLLVVGPVAKQVAASIDSLWRAMAPVDQVSEPQLETPPAVMSVDDPCSLSRLSELAAEECWDDNAARVALVRSFPSSKGEDIVYRMILGTLQIAKKRIIITMGHSNYPRSLANALAGATDRGVQVQVLANSKFSCDILVNQRDLMLSCRDLLRVAPKVELYLTCWKPGDERPPFVHAKYVTMDGLWSAVGSWNVWTRGSFYELEHEAMIESEAIARALEDKFEVDKASTARVYTADELEPGRGWCSTGCGACRGFGPFYKP
jgi:PLD-like domain